MTKSFLPEPTTRERIEAQKRKRKGGHEACDVGLFSDDRLQTDLVDATRLACVRCGEMGPDCPCSQSWR